MSLFLAVVGSGVRRSRCGPAKKNDTTAIYGKIQIWHSEDVTVEIMISDFDNPAKKKNRAPTPDFFFLAFCNSGR